VIIKTPKTSNFTSIDRRVLEDSRLTWGARGMLAYLLSKPNHWEVRVGHLISESPDGRRRVEKMLHELEKFGYSTTEEQQRGERGRFDRVSTTIHEEPTTGFPTKAQVAPKAETYNGKEAQFGTDAHLPRAVDVPLVTTDEVKNQNLVPRAQAHDGLDEELKEAAEAYDSALQRLWPSWSPEKRVRFRAEAVGIIERAGAGDEITEGLSAAADRMLNRADRIETGQSAPVETEGFSLGVVERVVNSWLRDSEWIGSNNYAY
jgi:hypothetical protein